MTHGGKRSGAGRKKTMPAKEVRRTRVITLNDYEWQEISEKAAHLDLSKSEFVRLACATYKLDT